MTRTVKGERRATKPHGVTAPTRTEASLGARVQVASARLGLTPEALLAAIEGLALRTPAAEGLGSSLTDAEEAVLRESGSLTCPSPDLGRRASFQTGLLLERMLQEALTVKAAALRLGVTEGRVRQRLSARTLLGIVREGQWKLPEFPFTDSGDLPGLSEVLLAFPDDVHPASVLTFFEAPSAELDVEGEPLSPRRWLETGGSAGLVAQVVRDAYELP